MDKHQPSAAVLLLLSAGKARVKERGILLQTRGYAKPVVNVPRSYHAAGFYGQDVREFSLKTWVTQLVLVGQLCGGSGSPVFSTALILKSLQEQ